MTMQPMPRKGLNVTPYALDERNGKLNTVNQLQAEFTQIICQKVKRQVDTVNPDGTPRADYAVAQDFMAVVKGLCEEWKDDLTPTLGMFKRAWDEDTKSWLGERFSRERTRVSDLWDTDDFIELAKRARYVIAWIQDYWVWQEYFLMIADPDEFSQFAPLVPYVWDEDSAQARHDNLVYMLWGKNEPPAYVVYESVG